MHRTASERHRPFPAATSESHRPSPAPDPAAPRPAMAADATIPSSDSLLQLYFAPLQLSCCLNAVRLTHCCSTSPVVLKFLLFLCSAVLFCAFRFYHFFCFCAVQLDISGAQIIIVLFYCWRSSLVHGTWFRRCGQAVHGHDCVQVVQSGIQGRSSSLSHLTRFRRHGQSSTLSRPRQVVQLGACVCAARRCIW